MRISELLSCPLGQSFFSTGLSKMVRSMRKSKRHVGGKRHSVGHKSRTRKHIKSSKKHTRTRSHKRGMRGGMGAGVSVSLGAFKKLASK